MLSGNTDCYQPVERELGITREILEVFWKYRHPVGIITKNSLVLRDLDLLEKLASKNLVRVALSITTLNDELRRFLEPRTASIASRFSAVTQLSARGIPVNVMMAPVIPGLNEHEILPLAKEAANAGARNIHHSLVRLNGDIATLFEDWLRRNLPARADKVLNKIRSCHEGQLGNSRFGDRMRGKGAYADLIHRQFELARKRFFSENEMPPFNLDLHKDFKDGQLKLF
jgi:DNA repair photolyase